LSKSGSAQFLPTYTGASGAGSPTNQYYQISGGGAGSSNYYDANGNLKNDVTHSYTWDTDGNMTSVDGSTVTMIYDALDRMIEQTRGSSHTEIVYGPYGMKLALMNGQTLVSAFVKLPGGGRAVYKSTGLAFYRHADHLGNSRLSTTPSRARYYQAAYAPYGEDYAPAGNNPDLAFTDQNQDTVSGSAPYWSTNLYDFMFREYRTAHGRWTSPDPGGLAVVDPMNPQSWNRYGYVLNNPMALIDPFGLDSCTGYSGPNQPTNPDWCAEAGGQWHPSPNPNPSQPCSPAIQGCPGSLNPNPPSCPPQATSPCGGGGSTGGGNAANNNPQPQKPKSPARQQCEANAAKKYQDTFSAVDKGFARKAEKSAAKGALWGGAVGCAFTLEIGCAEGGLPLAVIGGASGAAKSMWEDLGYVGMAYLQYRDDMSDCKAIP